MKDDILAIAANLVDFSHLSFQQHYEVDLMTTSKRMKMA